MRQAGNKNSAGPRGTPYIAELMSREPHVLHHADGDEEIAFARELQMIDGMATAWPQEGQIQCICLASHTATRGRRRQ